MPLFATGPGAEALAVHTIGEDVRHGPYIDNTAIFDVVIQAMNLPIPAAPAEAELAAQPVAAE